MKKIFVTILIAFLTIPVFSQLKFGIKVGAGTTSVPSYDLSSGAYSIVPVNDLSFGYHAGIFLRLKMWAIYLQPEVLFATNTYAYKVNGNIEPKKQTFNRIDVPILLGVKLGPVRINAGPTAAIPIGSPDALIDDPNFKNLYNGATFGYQAGIGFDLVKKITFDVRYEGSLSSEFGDAVTVGTQSFKLDSRQPSLLLSLGLMF